MEFINKEYYYIKSSSNWIIHFDRIQDDSIYTYASLACEEKHFYLQGLNSNGNYSLLRSDMIIRKATDEEICWLQSCISARKFVSEPEIKSLEYLIFN